MLFPDFITLTKNLFFLPPPHKIIFSLLNSDFASAEITTPGAGSEIVGASAGKSEKTNASFISRVNYDYKNRYLLTANFRADGSSNFGPNNKWGYFPSFSAGWRISSESFLENAQMNKI